MAEPAARLPTPAAEKPKTPRPDPREARAQTSPRGFARLALQLAALVALVALLPRAIEWLASALALTGELRADLLAAGRVFERSGGVGATLQRPGFLLELMLLCTGGFCLHYWLPLRFKEPAWIAVAIAGFALLDPRVAAALVVAALAFYAVLVSPLPYALRAGLVVASAPLVLWAGAAHRASPLFVAAFGSVFAFRMIVYLYDAKHFKKRPPLVDYLAYFFMAPNAGFFFFPVVNLQTMRASFYQRDIHETAQIGVRWMAKGLAEIAIYAVVIRHFKQLPIAAVTTPGGLLAHLALFYFEYLWVSGSFHLIVGVARLYGYALPDTHRNWALARSPLDLWRRINIYWKDFQVKVFYFPIYFRLRKWNDKAAQLIGTAAVFPISFALHVWLAMWLNWEWKLTQFRDAWTREGPLGLFEAHKFLGWAIFGALCVANQLVEMKDRGKKAEDWPAAWSARGRIVLQIAATAAALAVLRRLIYCASLREFVDLLRFWS